MTEQELRRRFQAAFGEPLPASALAAAARRSLQTPVEPTIGPWVRQAGAAAIAVLIAVIIGGVVIAGSALHSRLVPAASQPRPRPSHVVISQTFEQSFEVPLSQAQADSPEPLLIPMWLPFSNPPLHVQEFKNPGQPATSTILLYSVPDGRSVLIREDHESATGSWWVTSPRSAAGTVGGLPAVFTFSSDGTPTGVEWQRSNGRLITMSTVGLSKDEVTRIADSLRAITLVPKTPIGSPAAS